MTPLQTQLYQEINLLDAEQKQQVLDFIKSLKNTTHYAETQTAIATHQQLMTQYHDLFKRLADA